MRTLLLLLLAVPMPRPRLFLAAAVAAAAAAAAVGRVGAYDVPLNTHKLDFWDTNQVGADRWHQVEC